MGSWVIKDVRGVNVLEFDVVFLPLFSQNSRRGTCLERQSRRYTGGGKFTLGVGTCSPASTSEMILEESE